MKALPIEARSLSDMHEAVGPRDVSKPQKQKIWIIFFENGIQIPDCVFRVFEAFIQTFLVGSARRIDLFLSFFHLKVLSFQSFLCISRAEIALILLRRLVNTRNPSRAELLTVISTLG